MKKEVKFISVFLLFLIVLSVVVSADNDSTGVTLSDTDSEDTKISAAYTCLSDLIDSRECDELGIEERIFALLASGKCKSEVWDDSKSDECWPKGDCDLKMTSQALIAMDKRGGDTSDIEDWLLDHEIETSEINWYLQIDSSKPSTCEIKVPGGKYSISINEDKKLSGSAGSCLSLTTDKYWLRVSSSCFEDEIEVSCDEQFVTNLIFKKQDSNTIHISSETHSSGAEGTTFEEVNSSCFSESSACDYEGTLWATLALETSDNDDAEASKYLPYLIAMADENEDYLPEAFLYSLTGSSDFRNKLLLKQKSSSYWDETGDKFYDTFVALLPFQYEDPQEKQNAGEWLLGIQGDDGCWRGSVRDTSLALYALWPRSSYSGSGGDGDLDCEDSGYYCMSSLECGGTILYGYECAGSYKCCDSPKTEEACVDQGGEICNSGTTCIGGTEVDAGDLKSGEVCCYLGSCETQTDSTSECESYGGLCKLSCSDSEEREDYTCDFTDVCCVPSQDSGSSYWWIWLLAILIILVVLGIIFKDKIRPSWEKLKSKFNKKGSGSSKDTPPRYCFPPPQRRILPPSQPMKRLPKKSKELEEVLKKLKEIGK